MVYCRTINVEKIIVHPMDSLRSTQFVELTKYGDEPAFSVSMNDGVNDWYWEFNMTCPSDYEKVKINIFDAVFECSTMIELANALNAIFINMFEEILILDECGSCDRCKYLQ